METIIRRIQQFDPPGGGLRDLQESVHLQLQRQKMKETGGYRHSGHPQILDEFTQKHYEKSSAVGYWTKTSQGRNAADQNGSTPNPEEISAEQGGKLCGSIFHSQPVGIDAELRNALELRISGGIPCYDEEYDCGAKPIGNPKPVLFIKQKIDAANGWLMRHQQRQQTLLGTMTAIMEHQGRIFMTGDETTLRPMI